MTTYDATKVGMKGEILPKKPLREIAGIKPGDNIMILAYPGKLVIQKIYTPEELLSMPKIAKGTVKSIKKDIRKEAKLQEKITDEEH